MHEPRSLRALALGAAISTLPACASAGAAPGPAVTPRQEPAHTGTRPWSVPLRRMAGRVPVDTAPPDNMPILRPDPNVDYKILVLRVCGSAHDHEGNTCPPPKPRPR